MELDEFIILLISILIFLIWSRFQHDWSPAICKGSRKDRSCQFNYLVLDPISGTLSTTADNEWLVLQDWWLDNESQKGLLDLAAMYDHGHNFFHLGRVDPLKYEQYEDQVILIKRFYSFNIFHMLHDDWLGLFHLPKIWPTLSKGYDLILLDEYKLEKHDLMFNWLAKRVMKVQELTEKLQIKKAIVGTSKKNIWYQYGFGKIQGKEKESIATSDDLMEASKFIIKMTGKAKTRKIVILSRSRNRLILNEKRLQSELSLAFGLEAKIMRLEENSFEEIIAELANCYMAVGMHGSILGLSLVMPPDSVLIELFPWRVPPDKITPFKTMLELPGKSRLVLYARWECDDRSRTIGHPERLKELGGLNHLPIEEQNRIVNSDGYIEIRECCTDPDWLYHVFQDTVVDIEKIIEIGRSTHAEIKKGFSSL